MKWGMERKDGTKWINHKIAYLHDHNISKRRLLKPFTSAWPDAHTEEKKERKKKGWWQEARVPTRARPLTLNGRARSIQLGWEHVMGRRGFRHPVVVFLLFLLHDFQKKIIYLWFKIYIFLKVPLSIKKILTNFFKSRGPS